MTQQLPIIRSPRKPWWIQPWLAALRALSTLWLFTAMNAMALITFDAATSTTGISVTSLSWSHTVGSSTNRMLVVGVTYETSATTTVSSVTYGGVTMTRVTNSRVEQGTAAYNGSELWYLAAPASGPGLVRVTYASSVASAIAGAVSLAGVTQSGPEAVATNLSSSGTAITCNISTLTDGAWVLDVVNHGKDSSVLSVTSGYSQTKQWGTNTGAHSAAGGTHMVAAHGSVTHSWTTTGTTSREAMSMAAFAPASPAILTVNLDSPTPGQTISPGTSISASATVISGTAPHTVRFFSDISGSYAQVGADLGSPPYQVSLGTPAVGDYHVYATVTDSASGTDTSDTVPFTVSNVVPSTQYIIVISVDGLGGTYLGKMFDGTATGGPYAIPNFRRLKNEGASTLAAHIDNNNWETLPNHSSIVTGRPRDGTSGHNWTSNGDPAVSQTLHSNKGSYVASIFDVAHDNGLRTGMYANKTKFSLFHTYGSYTGGGSYDAAYGAPDSTGADNGRNKVDNSYIDTTLGGVVVDTYIAQQQSANPNQYAFLHINEPDSYGHGTGWGSATWYSQVAVVDTMLGKILKLIEQDVPAMTGHTTLILTADHGNQDNPLTPADRYTVPFFVWGTGVAAGTDLYALNPGTRQVAASYPMTTYDGIQPIRNAEANNLALDLLKLGPIPGSVFNSAQDLLVAVPIPDALTVAITSPANNATVTPNFTISATDSYNDGTVQSMAFYDGATLLGSDTTSPYSYTWTNAPLGSHALSAVALDNHSQLTNSDVVNVTVISVPTGTTIIWNSNTGTWNYSEANWLEQNSGLPTPFSNGQNVIFNKTTGGTITIDPNMEPASTTVSAAAGTYIFTGGPLSGTGALSKSDGGNLILNGSNSYTGTTTVTGGILKINGSTSASSALEVSAGGIAGTGTINGPVTLSASGGIGLCDGATGTLTLGNSLAITGATGSNTLSFDLGAGTAATDKITVAGAVVLAHPVRIALYQIGGSGNRIQANTYDLLSAGSGTLPAAGNFILLTTKAFGETFRLALNSTSQKLQLTTTQNDPGPTAAFWSGGTGPYWSTGTNWNTNATSNMVTSGPPSYQTNVTFHTTTPSAANLTTTLDADFDINTLTFANTATSPVTLGGPTKTLTLEGSAGITVNTPTTGTVTHTINAKVGLAASQIWTVNPNATLTVNGPVTDLIGSANFTKAGTGTLNLSGSNTYAGATTVNAGTLALGATASLSTSSVELAAGGTLNTSAQTSFVIPAATPVTVHLSGADAGSAGRITAAGLDITHAHMTLTIDSALDDMAYVLANYTSLTGTRFLSVTTVPGYSINYTYNNGTQIALVANLIPGFEPWAQTNITIPRPGADSSPTGDPDGDGSNNLNEYAFGGNPLSATDNAKAFSLVMPTSRNIGDELVLTIAVLENTPDAFDSADSPVSINTVDGVTYTIQGSNDLNFPNARAVQVNPLTTPEMNAVLPVGYKYLSFALDGSATLPTKGFIRAVVGKP